VKCYKPIFSKSFRSTIIKTKFINTQIIEHHLNKKSLKIPITTLKSAQEGFKKRQIETRIGMQDTTTRLCLMNGRRPRAVKQQQLTMRGILSILVWCCAPIHRYNRGLVVPDVDKCIITQHLEQISAKTTRSRLSQSGKA
jgi:hypothetical protein